MASRHPLAGLRRYLDWRAVLVYLHRWLGIAGCLLFIAWFGSGVVLMYARMPEMAPEEQLARSVPLDLSKVRLTPGQAFEALGADGGPLEVAMLGARPVYRVGGRAATVIYADTGDLFEGFEAPAAEAQARRFEPAYAGALHRAVPGEPRPVDPPGHDKAGGATANQRLSEQRAQAAKDFLLSRGIEPDRIMVFGHGERDDARAEPKHASSS